MKSIFFPIKWLGLVSLLWVVLCLFSRSAQAFDYLGHIYISDVACREVQGLIGARLEGGLEPGASEEARSRYDLLAARYVALGLFCPREWRRPYCEDGAKQAEGTINLLEAPRDQRDDYAVTLGDYAALRDHFAAWGPVRGLPRAGDRGLLQWTWRWLAGEEGSVGGVVEDVAEHACRTRGLTPWPSFEKDIEVYLEKLEQTSRPWPWPERFMSPLVRAPAPLGPGDPSWIYTIDNPLYLDLILRNHDHFGEQAYAAWLGFHSAAVQIEGSRCEDTIALDFRTLRRMARRLDWRPDLDWKDLSEAARARAGCQLLGEVVRRRVIAWQVRAPVELTRPVDGFFARLGLEPDEGGADGVALSTVNPLAFSAQDAGVISERTSSASRGPWEPVVNAVSALVFEGAGLHYLQDSLAAGHMRTIRTRGGLKEARWDHDRDNREGVVAILRTRGGEAPFVALGDRNVFGPDQPGAQRCQPEMLEQTHLEPAQVTACIRQHQRGLLVASSMSSLLDWGLGGPLFGYEVGAESHEAGRVCEDADDLVQFACSNLPSEATRVTGQQTPEPHPPITLHHGSLPVPPPPFSYESVATRVGFDITGQAAQISITLTLLSELGHNGYWLTSHRVGVYGGLGNFRNEQWFLDYAYSFHWRMAARFTLDAGASAFLGFRDFGTESLSFFSGLSPTVGLTGLPEGWIKIPLEITLTYRLPLTFFTSSEGFFGERVVNGHWFYVGLGLAFMR